ncbi:hypothetical protein H1R20_g15006, partial [Candolleomyces eurysporus]
MLSTRTKQVNAYGRRGRRVVDVTVSNAKPLPGEIVSIFDDLPPPPAWAPIASRMKGRENAAPKPKTITPKVVGTQKKKRLSPVLSPKKPVRVAQLIKESAAPSGTRRSKEAVKPKAKSLASGEQDESTDMFNSPPRAPLSSYSVNVLGSPSIPSNARAMKQRIPSAKLPSKLSKPAPSIVKMDIIVLDDEGRTISKEKRVSRTGVEAKVAPRKQGTRKPSTSRMPIYVDSASESEEISHPKLEKRLKKGAHKIVLTDDSSSEDESPLPPPAPVKSKAEAKPTKTLSTKPLGRAATIEVVIPPAPYSTQQVPRLSNLPQTTRPEAPLKRNAPVMPTKTPAFPLPPSPVLKPRPLTPIRRGQKKGLFEPPSPPSPSTTDLELELSLDFSELSLDSEGISGPSHFELSTPEYLRPLLAECHQEDCGPHDFSSFIESFPFDPILQDARERDGGDLTFKKIGEASYSEVFGIGNVVLKVIPLRDESPRPSTNGKQHMLKLAPRNVQAAEEPEYDGPPPSDAQDVCKEIVVTRAMGEVHGGFVKLLKTYVVKGKYPEELLSLWDEYNEERGSESIRPDTFTLSQVYAIIVLPNGGPDLEAYTFSSPSKSGWRQACSIFWQVTKSLAHAEHLVSFEHRDLHWGQILVRNVSSSKPKLKAVNMNAGVKSSKRATMDDLAHGVQVTVIDLGLSRMDAGDGSDGERVHWTPFDAEVFMGEGDYQYDIYRMMRDLTGEEWEGYHPMTNVMWLHYLASKLLRSKGLKPPSVARKSKSAAEPPLRLTESPAFSEKVCYEALVDVEQWLGQTLGSAYPARGAKASTKGRGRRATVAPVRYDGPVSAGEIAEYGVKKGWIREIALF